MILKISQNMMILQKSIARFIQAPPKLEMLSQAQTAVSHYLLWMPIIRFTV
jgi:hypothetical protein